MINNIGGIFSALDFSIPVPIRIEDYIFKFPERPIKKRPTFSEIVEDAALTADHINSPFLS